MSDENKGNEEVETTEPHESGRKEAEAANENAEIAADEEKSEGN